MDAIFNEAKMIAGEIIKIRRDIHSHPEMGNEETRTTSLINEKLKTYGVDEILSPLETGAIGVIRGSKDNGKCVALRCDIDALPVVENTGLEFTSKTEGVMHACGHDLHTAMMLGNAKILCNNRDKFEGTVKVIFEPSEETQPGGARAMVASGLLDDVEAFFGMHVVPSDDNVGMIGLKKGPVTTSADEVHITVHGKGGHGSQPNKAKDAVLAACQLNVLFEQIQARNVDPLDTCIFTINTIEGGIKVNVIPEECKLVGALRAYTPETRKIATQKIHDICRGVEAISGCVIDDDVNIGYDACINDEALVDMIMECFDSNDVENSYFIMDEPMGFSEDYSFFATKTGKPSTLMFLNAGHSEGMCTSTLHSPDCTFNEDSMVYGISAMVNSTLAYLK